MQPQLRPPYPPGVRPVAPVQGGPTPSNPSVVQAGAVGPMGAMGNMGTMGVNVSNMAPGQMGLQQPAQQQWVPRPQMVRPSMAPSMSQERR